MGVGSTLDLR